ncbi:hypothetical protein A2630_03660 [Candidatus Woesebacteria bacterium RIFCSPHIGHO2_01_FULL_44_10]|uniref:Ribbon-helix-helix protein CopG domain-containing protein n=1 Tax=Candidatus Woesebacteria bacterium RIFCSPLOWO2_01_FULL_44_14 TaxID=1802525 RepID=A0A1F8C3S2_9BACT|nr:MAG: hypothetical protein A2630_03660 [Candidatus Woesebacteria bacterium RIFCSPHIGHO2_01_FULL_44_10]OGM54907.1 MAG: hypothetical protein A3F62_04450 [Candidatus Woesebacteria bacterium RIFCSPHIGHO2_12_FULL_44_11]OGM70318.1 MAG: hypothetical protein A2975_04595 [Candidatus Woesebacteria bacterium RIFCSPLOWO2_01_FULL_44_14]
MQTVNISLPTKLAGKLDQVVDKEGYASRSEFVRSLLRFYLLTQRSEVIFKPFKKVSLSKIKREMKATGQYNEKFIESVIGGLSKSSVYAPN